MDQKRRPVLHVLMADGRISELATRTVVIPKVSDDEADNQILYTAINGRGEAFVDTEGNPIVLPESAPSLIIGDDPNALCTYQKAAQRCSVSATIRRAVR
jgi:hypothetical protein